MTQVITPTKKYNTWDECKLIKVFLAGGITNCWKWQDELINIIKYNYNDPDNIILYNPRRENFPIEDKNAAREQIIWEYEHIEKCDIFSMYFCAGDSDQPICMYELGRNILRMQQRFPADWQNRIIITVEDEYRRRQDVLIQTELATNGKIIVGTQEVAAATNMSCIEAHARRIMNACMEICFKSSITKG